MEICWRKDGQISVCFDDCLAVGRILVSQMHTYYWQHVRNHILHWDNSVATMQQEDGPNILVTNSNINDVIIVGDNALCQSRTEFARKLGIQN